MTAATLAEVLGALDPEQHAVATAPRGPVCVLAGAGTGKTRALTHRIAALVARRQVDPRQVLALTFTARAAGELRGRLRALGVDGVQARTFHAAALRQLRFFWPIRRRRDSRRGVAGSKAPLVAEAACRLRVTSRRHLGARPRVRDRVGQGQRGHTRGICGARRCSGPGRARRARPRDRRTHLRGVRDGQVATAASSTSRTSCCSTAGMIDDDAAMAATVRDQYRCLLVDEYQDVSPIQQRLLDLWLADRDDLTVVGDANQTIYSFAGATPGLTCSTSRDGSPARRCVRLRTQLSLDPAGRRDRQPAPRVGAWRRSPASRWCCVLSVQPDRSRAGSRQPTRRPRSLPSSSGSDSSSRRASDPARDRGALPDQRSERRPSKRR